VNGLQNEWSNNRLSRRLNDYQAYVRIKLTFFFACILNVPISNICSSVVIRYILDSSQLLHRINFSIDYDRSTRWRSWLRHYATSRVVAVSIPDHVIGIFHWHNPTVRTMALGLTHPLIEMNTRDPSRGGGVKVAGG
jgi:hypothetical protein